MVATKFTKISKTDTIKMDKTFDFSDFLAKPMVTPETPAFTELNRIDDVVIFQPLGLEDIERIVDIQLKDVRSRLANERMTLELSEAAKQSLALDGLDPVYGARPLKRLIQRRVVDQVANLIIAGELHEGDTVLVDTDENGNLVARKK